MSTSKDSEQSYGVEYISQHGTPAINKGVREKASFSEGFEIPNIDEYSPTSSVVPSYTKTNLRKTKGFELHYNFDKSDISTIMSKIRQVVNHDSTSSLAEAVRIGNINYNRFKTPILNDKLTRTFGHVFFTRPDCNIFENAMSITGLPLLTRDIAADETFRGMAKRNMELLQLLTLNNNKFSDDFAMNLNNRCTSFSLNDEFINTTEHGKTYTGHQIIYGKNNIESNTAGEITVGYEDDRETTIYDYHKLWLEYISNVSRGRFAPKDSTILKRELDYAASCYYFLLAEDGETIVFWTKFYGVFPTSLPNDQYAWTKGNVETDNTFDIRYKYSWKKDKNPLTLMEFNHAARMSGSVDDVMYVPNYDPDLAQCGTTWVGTPFVELVNENNRFVYKLRFKGRKTTSRVY